VSIDTSAVAIQHQSDASLYPRHCERSEAIHLAIERKNGLLRRFAPRNDGIARLLRLLDPNIFSNNSSNNYQWPVTERDDCD
jgi:hypothetical protein